MEAINWEGYTEQAYEYWNNTPEADIWVKFTTIINNETRNWETI